MGVFLTRFPFLSGHLLSYILEIWFDCGRSASRNVFFEWRPPLGDHERGRGGESSEMGILCLLKGKLIQALKIVLGNSQWL